MAFHLDRSAVIVGLSKRVKVTIASVIDQSEPFLMSRSIRVLENGNQLFVIFSQKANVNVIIPGNVSLVANCPQERAVGKAVFQVVFFADAFNFVQNGHLDFATFLLFNLFHFLFPAETAFLSLSIFFLTTRP